MDIKIRDRVKAKEGDTLGAVVAITHWDQPNEDGAPGERWDIGVKPDRSDRIVWLDSEAVRVTKAA